MFNERATAAAWRRFVDSGRIDERTVRPEIAASWRRCREAGLNAWTVETRYVDEARLIDVRNSHARLLRSANPVMRVLSALLDANVSLMDEDSFIYHLVSPFESYPRALGATMDERIVGTCNATLVKAENKPIRCDYFEHYKVGSQSYSGAAAPFLHEDGSFGGAILVNSPLEPLPDRAPVMASVAARMIRRLYNLDGRMWQALTTAEFFAPLIQLSEYGVALLSDSGNILTMNDALGALCPGWANGQYGTQPFKKYLVGGQETFAAIDGRGMPPRPIEIKGKRGKEPSKLTLVLSKTVELERTRTMWLVAFEMPKEVTPQIVEKRWPSSQHDGDVRYIGESAAWKKVDSTVRRVAPIKVSVLLLGETGTGKEVMARAIHEYSGRKGPFVAINCGAIPRDLMASELFGYAPGAFTGAQAKGLIGKFEYANGGTVFLDEVGEMPFDLQVGLLRVLQEQTVTRLGSNESRKLDVRFVAATNQDLKECIAEKRFRLDLYHRLSQIEVHLPPLRERKEDIPLFVESFNYEICEELKLPYSPFSAAALETFSAYLWPGNVRELRNVIERCLIFCGQGSEVAPDDVLQHASALEIPPK